MEEGKERKRQLPQVPNGKGKSSRKARSTSNLPRSKPGGVKHNPLSSSAITEAGERLSFSPPGTKPIVFTGYSKQDLPEGEDTCVTVAVRVRPFSQRENRLGAKQVINIHDDELIITSREKKVHRFCYDHCFWSFDNNSAPRAGQDTVYKALAQPLLDKAFEGYNTCLFAYGQTGSGKSYCIMGEPTALGIIPQFAEELFERIEGTKDDESTFKVEVSYYEIYKERIHDLLASTKDKKRINLRVREHPVMGPYVEDLSTYVASSYSDIEQWLALGNRFRATASTGMNDRSSRSHSVFTLLITQAKVIEGESHSRVSRINLIDLAGSERSSVSNTSGERLKEGASINKSLHTLGKVISLLSEHSTGKRKKVYIPYRDSTLTWLLKESLGGNSKTAMIATVSPANLHYEESLSTLRYAQQARSIINVARINEDPSSQLIRQLKQEIELLRSQLDPNSEGIEVLDILKSQEEMRQLKERLKDYEKLMVDTTRSWEDRLKRTEDRKMEEAEQLKKAGVSFKVDNKLPNLVNLNEDPQLSEMLLYVLKEGETTVGRHNQSDIQLTGALVARDHCTIDNKDVVVTLYPSPDPEAQTFINGTLLSSSVVLHHGDRVVIAGEHFFRFNHPLEVEQNASLRKSSQGQRRNFEYARDEYIKAQTERLEAERLQERQEMMEELQAMKMAAEQEMTMQKQTYEDRLRTLEGTLADTNEKVSEQLEQKEQEAHERISELEKRNQKLEDETIAQRHIIELEKLKTQKEYEELSIQSSRLMHELEQEKLKLEGDIDLLQSNQEKRHKAAEDLSGSSSMDLIQGSELLRIATMLQEANVISKNLAKSFNFSREDTSENDEVIQKIKVTNTKLNQITFWELEKFETRLEQMREIYQSHGSLSSLDDDNSEEWAGLITDSDPFYDPQDEWIQDSFLSSYSPTSSTDGRRHSLFSFTPPGSGNKRSVRKSISEFASSVPKRLVHSSSLVGSPALSSPFSFLSSSFGQSHSSPKKTARVVTQICHDKIASMLQYKHESCSSVFYNILTHVHKLRSLIQELSETSCVEEEVHVLELYSCLELLLESSKSLETTLNNGSDLKHISLECSQRIIEDVSHHTALYCSKLLQALLDHSKDDISTSVASVGESLDCIVCDLGQLSLCVKIEDKLCETNEERTMFSLPTDEGKNTISHFYYGYQTWCSTFLETSIHSLHSSLEKLKTNSGNKIIYSLREVIAHGLQLVHQLSDIQELFWQSLDMSSSLELPVIVTILSRAYTTHTSLNNLCSTVLNTEYIPSNDELISINKLVSISCEQLAVSMISFIKDLQYDDLCLEVQALARNVAMGTRSLNQFLNVEDVSTTLVPPEALTPEKSLDSDSVTVPVEFLIASPSPVTSETSSHESSNTSLV